jgi:predicted metal-dependent hydrolase
MEIKIIRSARRKRTIETREINGIIELYIPLGLSERKELEHIQWARKRVEAGRRKKELKEKNAGKQLEQLTEKFNREYFEGKLSWEGIIYSTAQNGRMFGNCDIKRKTIRISDRLLKMPKFVHDYVLIHELAHLEIPGHGPNFWEVVNRYPKTERARGYLLAVGMSD